MGHKHLHSHRTPRSWRYLMGMASGGVPSGYRLTPRHRAMPARSNNVFQLGSFFPSLFPAPVGTAGTATAGGSRVSRMENQKARKALPEEELLLAAKP